MNNIIGAISLMSLSTPSPVYYGLPVWSDSSQGEIKNFVRLSNPISGVVLNERKFVQASEMSISFQLPIFVEGSAGSKRIIVKLQGSQLYLLSFNNYLTEVANMINNYPDNKLDSLDLVKLCEVFYSTRLLNYLLNDFCKVTWSQDFFIDVIPNELHTVRSIEECYEVLLYYSTLLDYISNVIFKSEIILHDQTSSSIGKYIMPVKLLNKIVEKYPSNNRISSFASTILNLNKNFKKNRSIIVMPLSMRHDFQNLPFPEHREAFEAELEIESSELLIV